MPTRLLKRRPKSAHQVPLLRRHTFWFMLVGGLAILIAATCLGLLLTPSVNVHAFDQTFAIGAQPPSFSLHGQAKMTEIGLPDPLQDTWSYGPVRLLAQAGLLNFNGPSLQGGSHDGAKIGHAWELYTLWGALIVLGISAAIWVPVFRFARRELLPRRKVLSCIVAVSLTTAVYVGFEAAGTVGLIGLTHSKQLGQIFETEPVFVPPLGKPRVSDTISEGAVIGESVASHLGGTGNPRLPCLQSSDSLAYWLSQFSGYAWRNLACSGATIPEGLLGPQPNGTNALMQPQVDELGNIKNLKQVVLVIGPDDVGWSFQMGLCFFTASCNNDLGETDFSLRLSRFVINYAKLLNRLSQLPTHPEVTVVLQYQLMSPQAALNPTCLDASSLTQAEIQLMDNYVTQLNQVLIDGATQFHYFVATPHLNELCPGSKVSQDIYQVLTKPDQIYEYAAHPTPQGERKIAWAVLKVLPATSAISAASQDSPSPSSGR